MKWTKKEGPRKVYFSDLNVGDLYFINDSYSSGGEYLAVKIGSTQFFRFDTLTVPCYTIKPELVEVTPVKSYELIIER